jgi:hypothetical protein
VLQLLVEPKVGVDDRRFSAARATVGLLHRFVLGLFAREKTPLPVAVSQPSPSAQLQAGRFLFLVQGKSFFTQPDDPLAAQVIEVTSRTLFYWHVFVDSAYAYRLDGPSSDDEIRRYGHRFNSRKVLIDLCRLQLAFHPDI